LRCKEDQQADSSLRRAEVMREEEVELRTLRKEGKAGGCSEKQ
jgi:hypothetical protein